MVARSVAAAVLLAAGLTGCASAAARTQSTPDSRDVAAAQACAVFDRYLAGAVATPPAPGDDGPLLAAARGLLVLTPEERTSGQVESAWSHLGTTMLWVTVSVTNRDHWQTVFDGQEVDAECHSIPVAAKRAAGYAR